MEIKPLNSNPPNGDRQRRNEDRIARLMQVSEEAVAESQQILDRVDNGLITEEERMIYDPEVNGMIQYGSNGVIRGSQAPESAPVNYNQQPQNGYYDAQRISVDNQMYNMYHQQPQQPIYYQQPRPQYNYNGYYNQTIPRAPIYNNHQGYYNPYNQMQYNPYQQQYIPMRFNNPYGLDPRDYDSEEEMNKEFEKLETKRRKHCESDVALAMFFRDFSEQAGAEFAESREEYYNKIQDAYGYKTFEEMEEEKNRKAKEYREQMMKNGKTSRYDERGFREFKCGLVVALHEEDENGNENVRVMSKPVNPETGYRTTLISRNDDEVLNFNSQHFWDPYIKRDNYIANFYGAINNRVKEYSKKYDSYTWEELTGPEAKMSDYYYDIVVKEDSNKIRAQMMKGRWSNGTSYLNNFWNSGTSTAINLNNMSNTFRTDYELAKQIHCANLSKTPEEIELDQRLMNSLTKDYDKKRAIFVNKMLAGRSRCNMAAGASQKEVIAAPNINDIMDAEAASYLAELDEQEKRKQEEKYQALMRQDNLDPTGGHIVSKKEIMNPGTIPGTNVPIQKRTVYTGVMTDEEARREFDDGGGIELTYDVNGNLISSSSPNDVPF